MYVDKRLSGVLAVQTLSRLNRTTSGKEDTFVLDFINDVKTIEDAFQPYYEQTVVAETADPHQLYELQHRLEAAQIFWQTEVLAFCVAFYAADRKLGNENAGDVSAPQPRGGSLQRQGRGGAG